MRVSFVTWLRKWFRNLVTIIGITQRALRMIVESGRHREDTTCCTQQLMAGKLKTVALRVSFVTWLRKRFRNLVTLIGITQRALRLTVKVGRLQEDTTSCTWQLMAGKWKVVAWRVCRRHGEGMAYRMPLVCDTLIPRFVARLSVTVWGLKTCWPWRHRFDMAVWARGHSGST